MHVASISCSPTTGLRAACDAWYQIEGLQFLAGQPLWCRRHWLLSQQQRLRCAAKLKLFRGKHWRAPTCNAVAIGTPAGRGCDPCRRVTECMPLRRRTLGRTTSGAIAPGSACADNELLTCTCSPTCSALLPSSRLPSCLPGQGCGGGRCDPHLRTNASPCVAADHALCGEHATGR